VDDLVIGLGAVIGTTPILALDENLDVTIMPNVAGNTAGDQNKLIGLLNTRLVGLAGGTDPAAQTVACFDEDPMGETAEVDGGGRITLTADAGVYHGNSTTSIKMVATSVTDDEGWDATIAADDLTDMESLGFWILSDEVITAGYIDLTLDESGGTDVVYAAWTVPVADVWTYVEIDVTACNGDCDATDGVEFRFTATGAANLTAPTIYVDGMWYWDVVDEDSLGAAILEDGVLSVVDPVDGTLFVEYTNYLVHYESGTDYLVWISDESAAFPIALVCFE